MPGALKQAKLDKVRAKLEAKNMPDVCNVITITKQRGAQGGWDDVETLGPDVWCKLVYGASGVGRVGEMELAARLAGKTAWTVILPYSQYATVRRSKKLKVTALGGDNQVHNLDIEIVVTGNSWQFSTIAYCTETT